MDEFDQKIHRTWVQLFIEHDYKDVAAIAVDTEMVLEGESDWGRFFVGRVVFGLPTSAYSLVRNSEYIQSVMQRAALSVMRGHCEFSEESLEFMYTLKLLDIEEGWENVVRNLIANAQTPNQGAVTEKAFLQRAKSPLVYNEMRFASQSEIRIAQELERRGVLFFPLPLAVRHKTGNFYDDYREPDFLICEDGVWGILEVAYHPDRYEKDSEKAIWFKESGILCVEHYTAERCYNNAAEVVEQFLSILAKHSK